LTPLALIARLGLEARSFDDIVAQARRAPGKLTVGVTGSASIAVIAVAMIERQAGIKLQTVSYKGGSQALVDLASGTIDLVVTAAPVALPQVVGGRIKAIGVLADKRLATAPEVPATGESRDLKGLNLHAWGGLVGPAKMPLPAVSAISRVLPDIFSDPAYQEEVRKRGDIITPPTVGYDFTDFLRNEEAHVRAVRASLKFE
jgi:tripartite-type tricarboxylate transporter receptor subunit TctC